MRWLWRRHDELPHRQQVVEAFTALPAIPEAPRMTHKPMELAKVKTVAAWQQRYANRKAS